MPETVLASTSPRRAELLRQIGLDFTVLPGDADETAGNAGDPAKTAESLALRKARSVAEKLRRGLVIGADTIVEVDGETLGKPGDPGDARRILGRLSGREHRVITGVAVIDAGSGRFEVEHETTRVWFRPLEPDEIEAYVETGEPIDKAGAYGIQGLGSLLVERIEGCYFNVVGLPLPRLSRMLKRFGLDLLRGNRADCSGSCGRRGAGKWRNGGVCGYGQPEHERPSRERAAEGEDSRVRAGLPLQRRAPRGDPQDGE